jgi:hypothetical protein
MGLQGLFILVAIVFAGVMTWRSGGDRPLGFSIFMLQAVTFESGLAIFVALCYPPLLSVLLNQREFIAIVAMMTVIYSARDIAEGIRRTRGQSGKKPLGN